MRQTTQRIGVDTGGTFTDLVLLDTETTEHRTVKVPSTPAQPSHAVFEAVRRAKAEAVDVFVLGTTIATNCLLERAGQRTVYLTTAGFEDVPFIQRIDRRALYDLQWQKPVPYLARADCLGVRERVSADGAVRIALSDVEIDRIADCVERLQAESADGIAVAINLLFSYINPVHERMLADALRERIPALPLSVASEVAPVWREYERANTVIVDAYLRRLTSRFAEEIDTGLRESGVTCPRYLLKSNGGQVPTETAGQRPVNFILSGLAGGMIGARHFAQAAGRRDVITLDMGGTSADVGVIIDAAISTKSAYEFEWGLPIAIPVIDISTIGAGGSSLAGFDQGGFLRVGPASAGADPGPAAYGKGGTEATVTDANLVLGRLNPQYFLGGEISLDAERALAAVTKIGRRLEISAANAAIAIIEVATENMANAVRLLCADRGLDYLGFDLMVFGGAGPLHGALLARRVGLRSVIVPPHPGLTSAFGAQAADLRVDRRITHPLRCDVASDEEVHAGLKRAATEAVETLLAEGATGEPLLTVSVSARYVGQNFEQDVPFPLDDGARVVERLVDRFHASHRALYGYALEDAVVEIVHINATALERRRAPDFVVACAAQAGMPVDVRPVCFTAGGESVDTSVYRREHLAVGQEVIGPAIVEEVDSTTVVLAGQALTVHPSAALMIGELTARDAES